MNRSTLMEETCSLRLGFLSRHVYGTQRPLDLRFAFLPSNKVMPIYFPNYEWIKIRKVSIKV